VKRLGIVGGMTWASTAEYYSIINRAVQQRLGGVSSADCLISSFNFADIARNVQADDQPANGRLIVDAAKRLKAAGSEGILLAANSPHLFAADVERETGLPLIHIAAETAAEIKRHGLDCVALLGTKQTMELDFFKSKLKNAGIRELIPGEADREYVHNTIFDELGRGEFKDETRNRFVSIIEGLQKQGAQGVILGCTEFPLLVRPSDVSIPTFDTTRIHAEAAVEWMLS